MEEKNTKPSGEFVTVKIDDKCEEIKSAENAPQLMDEKSAENLGAEMPKNVAENTDKIANGEAGNSASGVAVPVAGARAGAAATAGTSVDEGISADTGTGAAFAAVPPQTLQAQPQPFPLPQPKPKEPFSAGRRDGVFVLFSLLAGLLFSFLVLFRWHGWGVTLAAAVYEAGLLVYAKSLSIKIKKESWFWAAVFGLVALSYAFWSPWSTGGVRGLFLFGLAVYLNGSIFGVLLQGKTGNPLPLDLINLFFVVPFKNTGVTFKSIKELGQKKTSEKSQKKKFTHTPAFGVLIGALICVPLLLVIVPLLLEADSGAFYNLTKNIWNFFERIFDTDDLFFNIFKTVFGLCAAFYISWLGIGAAHRRYTNQIDVKKTGRDALTLKKLPVSTVVTVLSLVCGVYVLFVCTQVPYLFSAFYGRLPEGMPVYSEYARRGFFELSTIAGVNLALMLGTAVFLKPHVKDSKIVTALLVLLCGLTILLVATGLSKMALYIGAYGLSPKRVMTSTFMAFLILLCVAVVVLLFRWFSITRFAAIVGSVMLCALCAVNLDGIAAQYNANRYLAGTLPSFDVWQVQGGGDMGYDAALRVYGKLAQQEGPEWPELEYLGSSMRSMKEVAEEKQGTTEDDVSSRRLRMAEVPDYVAEALGLEKHGG